MHETELLDYCRVKKIFEKGFGFLTSLYFNEPVFFHFNKVKDPAVKEKLEKLKRGEVYFYFTSVLHNGKRKVLKLWLDIKDIDEGFIPAFIERIIKELNEGKTNVFEIAYVIKQLRENGYIDKDIFSDILSSKKLINTPSVLKVILRDNEATHFEKLNILIDNREKGIISEKDFIDSVRDLLY